MAGWIAFVCAVAVVIGSFGPWKEFWYGGAVIYSGLDGDGKITLPLGIAASILVLSRIMSPGPAWTMAVALLCLLVSGGVGIYDWSTMKGLWDEPGLEEFVRFMSPEWGLQTVTIAGFAGALAAAVHLLRKEIQ